jgi:hypothetical protein
MRVDHERLRTFIELRSLIGWSVNDNWNIQINSLAAPVFQPLICIQNQDKRYFPVGGTNVGWRFPTEHIGGLIDSAVDECQA